MVRLGEWRYGRNGEIWRGMARCGSVSRGYSIKNLKGDFMTDEKILKELQVLESKNGILKPEDVVEFARNKNTALHDRFTWDNTEAAHLWRLHEARNIIRCVAIYSEPRQEYVRAFVSLVPDRADDGGGYRAIGKVMSDEEMRKQLLADALREFETFKSKYYGLKELAHVFEEMDKVAAKKKKTALSRAEIPAHV